MNDDDLDSFQTEYEGGIWEWDNELNELRYNVDVQNTFQDDVIPNYAIASARHEFRHEFDTLSQAKFNRLHRRKILPGQKDIVKVQDVKDVALFTAPSSIFTEKLIRILHTPVSERFVRALIFYCQYYLQVREFLNKREEELKTTIATERSEAVNKEFKDNLEHVRLLVTKEYCAFILGVEGYKRFHHMGHRKRNRVGPAMDAHFVEGLMQYYLNMVWIALGRKSSREIELEISRMFKSDVYNIVKHKIERQENRFQYSKMFEKNKLRQRSPLVDALFKSDKTTVDYRFFGLGLVDYPRIPHRLHYFEVVLTAPEDMLSYYGISLGIVGLPRSHFDAVLQPIQHDRPGSAGSHPQNSRKSSPIHFKKGNHPSSSHTKSKPAMTSKLYRDIFLPEMTDSLGCLTEDYHDKPLPKQPCDKVQLERWLRRLRMLKTRRPTDSQRSSLQMSFTSQKSLPRPF